ncbi:MAG: glycerol-3-phosphate dehydrogenase C-terminal domain-containing protein, partial [Bacteroidota bacterium]
MAERVVDRVGKQMKKDGEKLKDTHTKEIELTGGPFKDFAEVLEYEKHIENHLLAASLTPNRAGYLVANYGKQSPEIIDAATQRSEGTDVGRLAAAEAAWCIDNELTLYPIDWVERRSGRLYFDMPSISPVLEEVLDVFAEAYQYTTEEREAEKQKVLDAIAWVSEFEDAPAEAVA